MIQISILTVFYHFVYFVVYYYHENCEFFGINENRLKESEYVFSLFGFLFSGSILALNGFDKWLYALFIWIFWFVIISYKGDSLKVNTLIIPLIIFFSEYYEIPIYIYRMTNHRGYLNDYIMIFIKLLMIVWVYVELERNKYNGFRFILDLMIFSIFYFSFGYHILHLKIGKFVTITFKLVCLLFVMYELYMNDGVRNGLS